MKSNNRHVYLQEYNILYYASIKTNNNETIIQNKQGSKRLAN